MFLYSIYHQRAGKTNLFHMRWGRFHAFNTSRCTYKVYTDNLLWPNENELYHVSPFVHIFCCAGGGRGFIGGHLTRMLRGAGYEVIHISRQPGVQTITWVSIYSQGVYSIKHTISICEMDFINLQSGPGRADLRMTH